MPHTDGVSVRPETFDLLPVDRTSTVVTDDFVPLAVEEVGARTAPLTVVFVHGYCLSMRSWYLQRRWLPARTDARLVFYDHRSHGRSGSSEAAPCTIDQLGRDLHAVLRVVAPRGPVVLVGHSMGGMAIMALARQQPEYFRSRIAGVALLGTAANGLAASWWGLSGRNPVIAALARVGQLRPGAVDRVRPLVNGLLAPVIRSLSYGDTEVSSAVAAFSAQLIEQTPTETMLNFLATFTTHDELSSLPVLRDRPVLVGCGTHDRLTPYRHAELIAENLPDAELLTLPHTGHMLQLERPDLVNDALLNLFDQVLHFALRTAPRLTTVR